MEAYCSLVYSDDYAPGAELLGRTLAQFDQRERIVLVTDTVSASVRQRLAAAWTVRVVPAICARPTTEFMLLDRFELDASCTKFWVWTLPYEQVVFMDADTLALKSPDRLFERIPSGSIAACPDAGWPDMFNSGVFACRPDRSVFDDLRRLADTYAGVDGSDQGILNEYFADSWIRLPYIYNVTPSSSYEYAPAMRRFGDSVCVMHFAGRDKPWHQHQAGGIWRSVRNRLLPEKVRADGPEGPGAKHPAAPHTAARAANKKTVSFSEVRQERTYEPCNDEDDNPAYAPPALDYSNTIQLEVNYWDAPRLPPMSKSRPEAEFFEEIVEREPTGFTYPELGPTLAHLPFETSQVPPERVFRSNI